VLHNISTGKDSGFYIPLNISNFSYAQVLYELLAYFQCNISDDGRHTRLWQIQPKQCLSVSPTQQEILQPKYFILMLENDLSSVM